MTAVAAGQQLGGVYVLARQHVGDIGDLLAQRPGVDPVGIVIGQLLGATPFGLLDGLGHGGGDDVGVHVHLSGDIAGGASDSLNERGR